MLSDYANAILIIVGWLAGGIAFLVGMRGQVKAQTNELQLMRMAFEKLVGRVDEHGRELAYLKGRADGRREVLDIQAAAEEANAPRLRP